VRIHVNRRGRRLVAPALGGVPVKLRAVSHLTDGRVRRARNHTRLFAERHHLVPPITGIFVADRPILLPRGKRFLAYIARHARRVDIVQCDGHAAKLPAFAIHPVFAVMLSVARARVACRFLHRHGMTARFVRIGHGNRITRHPGMSRLNPASWPPDRRSGVTLIRH
jgi:prepilin-type processing-associated H-X9-DG protein